MLQISYKNIREMKDLNIQLTDRRGKPRHISLIQMPNGIGKTTTMELIRYCLDKGALGLTSEEIQSFKPTNADVTNGEFRVKLTMDGQLKIVTLRFDYDNGTVKYTTTSTERGGEVEGLELGQDVESWFKKRHFVRLFVFDGELAGELLDADSASAEDAINALYHLDYLQTLYKDDGVIDRILNERMMEKTTNYQTPQGKKQLTTKLQNIKKVRRELVAQRESLKLQIRDLEHKITKADEKIEKNRESDQKYWNQYAELKRKDGELAGKILESTEALLNAMRIPNNFSDDISERLESLASQMGKLKLPKTQSMEFFEELAECTECICGRQITAKEKDIIKKRAQEYLTEDNIGEINAIKSKIRNLPEKEDISALVVKIKGFNRDRKTNERNLNLLDNKSKGKDAIRELNEKIRNWGVKVTELKEYLDALNETRKEKFESLNLDYKNNIFLCDKLIEELTNQLAEATDTVEFKNKALVLKSVLKQITERSLIRLKDDILIKTNERICKILARKDIKISTIGKCLTLSDRDGVSVGQELSIAYAFLSTLFSQSPHELPFIVDTPAAPLDLSVRREVAEILPELFSQVVIFITSSERNNFADQFYERDDCNFLTVEKNQGGVRLIDDLNVFQNFQSEELNGL